MQFKKNNNPDAVSATNESVGSGKLNNSEKDFPQWRAQRKTNNMNGATRSQIKQQPKYKYTSLLFIY